MLIFRASAPSGGGAGTIGQSTSTVSQTPTSIAAAARQIIPHAEAPPRSTVSAKFARTREVLGRGRGPEHAATRARARARGRPPRACRCRRRRARSAASSATPRARTSGGPRRAAAPTRRAPRCRPLCVATATPGSGAARACPSARSSASPSRGGSRRGSRGRAAGRRRSPAYFWQRSTTSSGSPAITAFMASSASSEASSWRRCSTAWRAASR